MTYFNYNGILYKENTAIINPNNRGLRYGDGVFETMKFINNKIIFLDEHLNRLWKGMETLQFDMPPQFSQTHIKKNILALIKKNNLKTARIRLNIFRGNGELYDIANHFPHFIIQAKTLPEMNTRWNSNGLAVGIYDEVKKNCDILSNLKHNNYLPYVMAALYAKKQKWSDAILLNHKEKLCDTTIANIFLIKKNIIYTPALEEGCVAGIIRGKIINELIKAGLAVVETSLNTADLFHADEVFLTNSIYDIRWVTRIENKKYGNILTKKIYSLLLPIIS